MEGGFSHNQSHNICNYFITVCMNKVVRQPDIQLYVATHTASYVLIELSLVRFDKISTNKVAVEFCSSCDIIFSFASSPG